MHMQTCSWPLLHFSFAANFLLKIFYLSYESQNILRGKNPHASSPTPDLSQHSPRNHILCLRTISKCSLDSGRLGATNPSLSSDHSLGEEPFPNIRPKPPDTAPGHSHGSYLYSLQMLFPTDVFTHHNILLNSIFFSSCLHPSFSFLLGEEWLQGRTHTGQQEWAGCLQGWRRLDLLPWTLHRMSHYIHFSLFFSRWQSWVFFHHFLSVCSRSRLFLLLTLTLSAVLISFPPFLMAHSDTIQVWHWEPFPGVGLQPQPTLDEPLCLLLLILHSIKSRILQFSCSSPCPKLHKCCSLHSLAPSEKPK